MKKGFQIFYIIVFFVICALPLLLMSFVKNDTMKLEKREQNPLPAYLENGRLNVNFSDSFEAWLADRIPFRAQLLSAANFLKGELLHAESSNVIVGREGWLFFNSERDDYLDTNALTDNQIRSIAVVLSLAEENVTSRGGSFTFVPMPNKASVYGEYMPAAYRGARENNLTRLMTALKEYGVNFVDMKQVMLNAKAEGKQVYHRRDSHWNYLGALIGYNAIMDSLGRPHETWLDAPYTVEKSWRGDLDKLLYPAGGMMDDQYVFDIPYASFRFTYPGSMQDPKAQLAVYMSDKEAQDMNFSTKNAARKDGSSLLMIRDSFGRAVLPFFIESYENATFRRSDYPDLVSLKDGTELVYEIVERNLTRLLMSTPYMYAPERPAVSAEGLPNVVRADLRSLQERYGLRLFGSLPAEAESGDGRIYLRLEQNGKAFTVEAFPVYDAKLMGQSGENGFSAILAPDIGLAGDYQVTVIAGAAAYDGGTVTVTS